MDSASKDHSKAEPADVASKDNTAIEELDIDTPSNESTPSKHQFTFFQKNKSPNSVAKIFTLVHANDEQLKGLWERLDGISRANSRTRRHIAELMILMNDVAQSFDPKDRGSTRKKTRLLEWLFYSCLIGFGLGWFFLSPMGHDVLTHIMRIL